MSLPSCIRFFDLKDRRMVNSWAHLKSLQDRFGFPAGRLVGHCRIWTEQEVADWFASRPTEPKAVNVTDKHISRRHAKGDGNAPLAV